MRSFRLELMVSLGLLAACGPGRGTEGDTEGSCDSPPPELMHEYVCFPVPEGLSDCEACDEECTRDNLNTWSIGDPLCHYQELVVLCGPDPMPEMPGQCCYDFAHNDAIVCIGRPFVVAGEPRVAPRTPRDDWIGEVRPALVGLSEGSRATLAELWTAAAAEEHASVASFARFALQLLAVGAPAALVEGAQRAMADEIAHARICYALASAYRGWPMGPGRLDMSDALGAADLAEMAAAAVREGCVGETVASLLAEAAAGQARDPAVRAALRQIAADEARHAQLAWRFVQWALGRSPAVHEAVREAFSAALARPVAARPWPPEVEVAALRAHGQLAPDEQAALCREVLAGVVAPTADALLARQARAA
ncbi:MAG TPA: ferritin-like domain-containing protein [Nannocystis sp.]